MVNLAAEEAPQKGEALAAERRRLNCDWVLYLGDDENDEGAFSLGGDVVSARIGLSRRSHARYYLRTQMEVDELLERLIVLREAALIPAESRTLNDITALFHEGPAWNGAVKRT